MWIRFKLYLAFLTVLTVVVLILVNTTAVYKAYLFEQVLFLPLLIAIYLALLTFNHLILNMRWYINLLYSTVLGAVGYVTAFWVSEAIRYYLLRADQQQTPLGWTFTYTWFSFLIFGVLLMLCSEFLGKRFARIKK